MLTRKKKRSYLTGEEALKKTDENKALMLPQIGRSSDVDYQIAGGGGDEGFQGEMEGALHQAIVKGDVESVKMILGSRVLADVNLMTCCSSSMKTPLCCAVTCGNVEIVGLLVECGADVNLSCGPNNDKPLHLAVDMVTQESTVAMLQLLLKLGAIPDAKNGKGETALHKAAKNGDPDCVAILLNFGADSSQKDCVERTPLHYAVVGKGTWKMNLECVRLLLEDPRIDVNAQDMQGYTALHLSTGNENSKCAALLLRYEADVTLRTSTGITALSMLARNLPDVISCLVDRFNGAVTIPNQCDPSDPNCEIKMDFSVLLPKKNVHLSSSSPVDKPLKIRQKKETELLTCLINTGNKKLLAHPLSSAFLLLKWRRVRKFFLASLLFQMMIVALFTVFVVEVYLIRCPYTRTPVSPSHSLSKRHAYAHPNPYPNPRAGPAEDQRGFHWFRVVPSKKKHKVPETTTGPPIYPHVNFPSTPVTSGAFAPQSPVTYNRQAGRFNKTDTNLEERPAGSAGAVAVVPEERSGNSEELEYATPPAVGSFAGLDIRRKIVTTPPTQPVSPPTSSEPEIEEELPKCSLNWPLYLIWLLLITCISVMALQEIFQLVHSPRRYVVSSENWAQWLLIASVMLTAWIRSSDGSTGAEEMGLEYWQYPAAACGILIAWALILFQVGRFPSLGLYVEMLGKVAANFGIFILAYACLLIAFALSFCVLFPEHPPFSSVPLSILKVFTMMVGEVDYEDLFYSEERSHDPILFPLTAHLLFGAFVLIMTIVLMNLLVGLAVSDIQGLQRGAKLDRLSRQTALIARFESFIFSKKLQTLLPASLVYILQENSLLALSSDSDDKPDWLLYFRPNDPRDRTLPKDIEQESLNLITASHSPLPSQPYFHHQNVSKDESIPDNMGNSYNKKARRSVSSVSHLNQRKNKNRHVNSNNRSDSNNSNDSHNYSTDSTKSLLDQRLSQVEVKLEKLEKGISSILEILNANKQNTKL